MESTSESESSSDESGLGQQNVHPGESRRHDDAVSQVGTTDPLKRKQGDVSRSVEKKARRRKQHVNTKKHRGRRRCPVAGCPGEVVNLKRHYENVHPDIPRFEVEKLIKDSKSRPKRSYPKKRCALKSCSWVGTRPDKHLQKHHQLSRAEALETAKQCEKQCENAKTPDPNRVTADALSDEFLIWFESLEGGYYIPKSLEENKRKQRETQNKKVRFMINQILEECFGQNEMQVTCLNQLKMIGRTTDNGSESVVMRLKEGSSSGKEPKTWGTIKNYLSALSHFFDFLQSCYVSHGLDIQGMRTVCRGIIHTVNKFVAEENQKRKLQTRDKIIPPEIMSEYFDKKMAKGLAKEIQKGGKDDEGNYYTEGKEIVVERLRNHIILQTALSSGKRCGVLCDMKCHQVMDAEESDNGERVVLVEDGKTFRTSGAAGIRFSARDFATLRFYVQFLRPESPNDQVFCQLNGMYSSVSDINTNLQAAFNDFGMTHNVNVPHITCTLIRKTFVSLSREHDISREHEIEMAKHMDHTVQTADKHYDTTAGAKYSAKFAKIVQSFIHYGGAEDDDDDDGTYPEKDMEQPEINESPNLECDLRSNSSQNIPGKPVSCRFGRAEVFSPDDRERVKRCCWPLIEKRLSDKLPIKNEDVMQQIKDAGFHFQDLFTRYTKRQLYHRVRLEWRKIIDKEQKENGKAK
ncbi:uncharacterized protein [Littorina saxatilis]|uniref:uncharacterized protein n=1 Tax=Littorina saxatilis TaxID=31220 RepID=UPI0038B64274